MKNVSAPVTAHDTFVIVPAFNEGEVVVQTLQPLIRAGFSVVVVDDGSADATGDKLSALAVHCLRHPVNLGQGAALQTGMDYALQQGAKILVHFDSDGQHQAGDIERLIQPILRGEADVVLGSRFLRPQDAGQVPPTRRMFLKIAVWVNWLLTGVRLSDAHNGFRALSASAASQIDLRENGFAHASEIVQQIRERKLRWVECPVTIRYTEYTRAKGQSWWNAFNIVMDLMLRRIFR